MGTSSCFFDLNRRYEGLNEKKPTHLWRSRRTSVS